MGSLCRARRARSSRTSRWLARPLASAGLVVACVGGPVCPGSFPVEGYGEVELVPTGWMDPESKFRPVEVKGGSLDTHMDSRGYFADACTPGEYDNRQYVALNLLGKVMRYTTDVSGAGCGCNAAFYLTSMAQNSKPSECGDHYCDANKVCGQFCAEIDIQEANQFAWHSTLHSATDRNGLGGGYGGGDGWDGPRDWGREDYAPGSKCIDTNFAFQVAVSFPIDEKGVLQSMDVTITQGACNLHAGVGSYEGNGQLTEALQAGMTPIVSYWSANDMLWMDGLGEDRRGPCARDDVGKCAELVRFYNFSVSKLPAGSPKPAPPVVAEGTSPPRDTAQENTSPRPRGECSKAQKEDCSWSQCCRDAGMQCYRKNEYWSTCKKECSPGGFDPEDTGDDMTPWSCEELGTRTPGRAASRPNASGPTTTAPVTPAAPSQPDDEVSGPEKLEALSSREMNLRVRLLDVAEMPKLEQGEPLTVLLGGREAQATVGGTFTTSRPASLPPPARGTPERTPPARGTLERSTRDGVDAKPVASTTPPAPAPITTSAPASSPPPAAGTAKPAPAPITTSAPASSPPPAGGTAKPSSQGGAGEETEAQRQQRLAALVVDGIDFVAAEPWGAGRPALARARGGGVLAAVLAYAAACAAACAALATVRRRRWALPGSQLYGRIADGEGVLPCP